MFGSSCVNVPSLLKKVHLSIQFVKLQHLQASELRPSLEDMSLVNFFGVITTSYRGGRSTPDSSGAAQGRAFKEEGTSKGSSAAACV